MAVPVIQTSFVYGEVSPSLYGRPDLARFHSAAATMRNMFVSYRGGSYSRAGTLFVGYSKQTGRAYPPRLIPYQFNVDQGLALEFGHQYMRVVSNGAFVTENPLSLTGATRANPCVITVSASSALSAVSLTGGVVLSYAPGDQVTLAGGVFTAAAVLGVVSTQVLSSQPVARGVGYAPADTVHLAGGTQTSAPVVTVQSTTVVSATIANAGTGGANGAAVVTGTTGTGAKFQANVTIAGGAITSVDSIALGGAYTVNPTTPATEPVVGAGLAGAELDVVLGVLTVSVTTAGALTANPAGGMFTQAATSGGGTGATFVALMGPATLSVTTPGVYTTLPANPVSQASTTGTGVGAQFTLTSNTSATPFATGDWAQISSVGGMTNLNGNTYVLTQTGAGTYSLADVFGNAIDSTGFPAFTSPGAAARIYTLATPYAETDLRYLKYTQSADVMSLTCVNTPARVEYQPADLSRTADDNWTLDPLSLNPTIAPPAGSPYCVATAVGIVNYAYRVTAVNTLDGSESIASDIGFVAGGIDIATTAGSITVVWPPVPNASYYNVYKALPAYGTPVPVGALYGFMGSAYATQFVDGNIVPDEQQVPPSHKNPFARGQVIAVNILTSTSDFTTAAASIVTATGSGAVLEVSINRSITQGSGGQNVIGPGAVAEVLVNDAGEGYLPTDHVVITGDGVSATAQLVIGAELGTYPAVCSYFQQRRVYANTLNNPATDVMSQPGSFKNFDTRIPTVATDAITGSPWSLQVNGIQWLVPTSGGMLVMTGLSAWLLAGVGSFATNVQAITPSTQDAVPQAFTGVAPTVAPIKINYDVIYLEQNGVLYYDLPYQLYALSEPLDLTENSSHLFNGFTQIDSAWCEQQSKVMWSVRSDGILLSLTFLKSQQVSGWARHDTQGAFQSVCSVKEPPVDALYVAVERYFSAGNAYTVERMDNRIWPTVEDCWCVDCGVALPQPTPAATLSASSAAGLGAVSSVTGLVGGSGYSSATVAAIVDDNGDGPGTGATVTPTIVGGVIVGFVFGAHGTGYINPALTIMDPTNSGSGASATCVLDNTTLFTASAAVFSSGDVGFYIRMGGGVAVITAFTDTTHVTANMLSPIVDLIPNTSTPLPQAAGAWTLSAPAASVTAAHLADMPVVGLADGNPFAGTTDATGKLMLPTPASVVVMGLGFTPRLQSIYLDAGEPTVQGQRKKDAVVTARIESSSAFVVGANQPDGSTQSPISVAPTWGAGGSLVPGPTNAVKPYNALSTPLYTGDVRIPVPGGYDTRGQVAIQQPLPLPLQVLAFITEALEGDTPEVKASPKPQQRGNS